MEDNPINQKVLLNHLTKIGHICKIANNGQEALERLYSDDKFDVILMDIQMPIMDGLECTQKIREREALLNAERRMPIIGKLNWKFNCETQNAKLETRNTKREMRRNVKFEIKI